MNKINERFDDQVNIYHAEIIAVLPPNTSDLFRHIVHSLFAAHTEARLNILGHVFDHPSNRSVRHGLWCSNLVRTPNFFVIIHILNKNEPSLVFFILLCSPLLCFKSFILN